MCLSVCLCLSLCLSICLIDPPYSQYDLSFLTSIRSVLTVCVCLSVLCVSQRPTLLTVGPQLPHLHQVSTHCVCVCLSVCLSHRPTLLTVRPQLPHLHQVSTHCMCLSVCLIDLPYSQYDLSFLTSIRSVLSVCVCLSVYLSHRPTLLTVQPQLPHLHQVSTHCVCLCVCVCVCVCLSV